MTDKQRLVISGVVGFAFTVILEEIVFDRPLEYNDWVFLIFSALTYAVLYWQRGNITAVSKMHQLTDKVIITEFPTTGKVEQVIFHLSEKDERFFYDIDPSYFKEMIFSLEKHLEKRKNPTSYGYDYAIRYFKIGNKEIFNWHKD